MILAHWFAALDRGRPDGWPRQDHAADPSDLVDIEPCPPVTPDLACFGRQGDGAATDHLCQRHDNAENKQAFSGGRRRPLVAGAMTQAEHVLAQVFGLDGVACMDEPLKTMPPVKEICRIPRAGQRLRHGLRRHVTGGVREGQYCGPTMQGHDCVQDLPLVQAGHPRACRRPQRHREALPRQPRRNDAHHRCRSEILRFRRPGHPTRPFLSRT